MIIKRLLTIIILFFCLLTATNASAKETQETDTLGEKLVEDMYKYFNTSDKDAFYDAIEKYKVYCLTKKDMHNFYIAWQSEIIYEINLNHFFMALRKTIEMSKDMKWRNCPEEYHYATYLMGVIYSLQGNIVLGEKHLRKAMQEADKNDSIFLTQIYKELANIKLENDPEGAIKNLEKAKSLLNPKTMKYEHSDITGFMIIAHFFNNDWDAVKKEYKNYTRLRKEYGKSFSETYSVYAQMAYYTACGEYDKALEEANRMTSLDQHKMRNRIFEISGDMTSAYKELQKYTEAKDSITSVIMIDDLKEIENDIEVIKMMERSRRDKTINMALILAVTMSLVVIACLVLVMRNRNRYLKKLKRKNRELEIMRDKAQEAERMKNIIRNNMSHEIRTPLNIISGFTQLMSMPDFQPSQEDRLDIAKKISNSSDQIVKIINNLLNVSSLTSTSYMGKDDLIACNDICREAMERNNEKLPAGTTFAFNTSVSDKQKIRTNAKGVANILDNLLDNACKFGDGGEILIECGQDDRKKNIIISITNQGKRIPEEQIDKIFELFYKIDEFKSGLGIGIPLSRQIAEQLGGELKFDKKYESGVKAMITLPLQ